MGQWWSDLKPESLNRSSVAQLSTQTLRRPFTLRFAAYFKARYVLHYKMSQGIHMVRTFEQQDMERVLDIWLRASIKAHDFIGASYWQSNIAAMREIYIPASETFVIEKESTVQGFCCLLDSQLAALFVDPDNQGHGLGKQLLEHVKSLRDELTLSVYKENSRSIVFYQSQGFVVIKEQIDAHTGHAEYLMTY